MEIKNLTIKYSNNSYPSVKNISFRLNDGEVIAIVGESGSGKSTILKAIMGLLPYSTEINGKILFNGIDLLNNKKELSKYRGTKITMIPQNSGGSLNSIKTIGKQYLEYIKAHKKINDEDAKKRALELFEMANLKNPENIFNSYIYQLSGGMQQRVGIAMALTFSPQLILADEPTSALDGTTQHQIIKEIEDIKNKNNTSMLFVTHNLGVASYIADVIIVMKNGEIVEKGKKNEVINNPKHEYTKRLIDSVAKIGSDRFV